MPTTGISRAAGVGPSTFTLRLPVDKGRLKAATVTQISGTSLPGGLYVTTGIATGAGTPSTIVAMLFAGPFTEYQPIGWTGDIPLEPDMEVYARFRTLGAADVKLSIITEA